MVPVIADGGISSSGDIAKAIRAGANMVMAGGLFASCKDSPAKIIICSDGSRKKAYYGSASFQNKGHNNHIEGVQREIETSGLTYADKLEEIEQNLQSSISYAGGKDLSSLAGVDYEVIA